MRVRDWMPSDPQAIRQDALLQQARDMMDRGGFRRLPVIGKDGRLLGIVTDRDLREHHGHLPDTRVTAALRENPVTVRPDDPIEGAADVLLGRKIGGLPVIDAEGRLVGIITETDLLRGLLGRRPGEQDPRSYVDVQLPAPTQTLSEALAVLEKEGCAVLGARDANDPSAARTFRLHLGVSDPASYAATLRGHGFAVRAIHQAAAANGA
jgi:acetoin utilization protein AcuB